MEEKTWAPGPLPSAEGSGKGPLPSPGLVFALGWGHTRLCAVLATCINKPPWPESPASPWALGGVGWASCIVTEELE